MSATPVYRHLEFVRNAETLWAKIETHWDWLAVKPDGQFVVGYPKREPAQQEPDARGNPPSSGGIMAPGATEGEHGVEVRVPGGNDPPPFWLASEDAARKKFREIVELQSGGGVSGLPIILRVHRIEQRKVVEEEFVVCDKTTYRGGQHFRSS
jgi:hypothetical protein